MALDRSPDPLSPLWEAILRRRRGCRTARLQVEVDPKFPQAIGIVNILGVVALFGNFPWDVILNPYDDTPFFASDYPVANELSPDPRFLYRVVPLAPDIAVRIRPDGQKRSEDMSFPHFRFRAVTPRLLPLTGNWSVPLKTRFTTATRLIGSGHLLQETAAIG